MVHCNHCLIAAAFVTSCYTDCNRQAHIRTCMLFGECGKCYKVFQRLFLHCQVGVVMERKMNEIQRLLNEI